MSFVQRAWLHTTRKVAKSLTVLLVLLTVSTLLLSTVAVRQSVAAQAGELSSQLLTGFKITNNLLTNPGTPRGGGTVSREQVDTLSALPGVSSYVASMNATADILNAEIFRLQGAAQEYSQREEEMYGNTVPVNAVNRSDLTAAFRAGTFTLAEGRHLTEDDHHKALVHKDFAEKNGLKIGDRLSMRANQHDEENRFHSTATVDAEIVGTFSGDGNGRAYLRSDLYQNVVFTDLDTARTLNATSVENEYYHEATFYVKNLDRLDSVMAAARQTSIDWQRYEMLKATDEFAGIAASIAAVSKLLTTIFIGTVLFGVAALALVLFLWLSERRKETGVLLATGVGKATILAQYLTENLLIFGLALGGSYLAAPYVAQALGNSVVSRASRSALQGLQGGQSFAPDFRTSTVQKTVDSVLVAIEPSHLLSIGVVGGVLVVVATLLASFSMLVKSPRALLTQIG